MKMLKHAIAVVLTISLIGCTTNVRRLDKPMAREDVVSGGVSTSRLSHGLAAWGRVNADPIAVAISARVLATAGVQPMRDISKREEIRREVDAPLKSTPDVTPRGLVAEAEQLASGNDGMLAIVESIGQSVLDMRGAKGGPKQHSDVIRPYADDIYTLTFCDGEPAQVAIAGDGDTDLDMYVYDEDGHLIESDVGSSDQCLLQWVPRRTGPFIIRIKNLGRVYNAYTLYTN